MDRRQFTVAATLGLAASALLALEERSEAGGFPEHEHHPMIRKALLALDAARDELKHADHDFGGHRKDALEAIRHAHEQLELCLKADKM